MALPQDKPNPVPEWAAGLKGAALPDGAVGAAPAPGVVTPPPEYGIAIAVYIHRAVADAMRTLADGIRQAGTDVEARTAIYNAASGIAQTHERTAATMGEALR